MSAEGRRIFNPPGHVPFSPLYSHICAVPISSTSRLISFAGQIGRDGTTPNTLAEQVKLALSNVDKCLEAAGAKKQDIISVRQYVVNLLPVDPSRTKMYNEWMGDHKPPSTLIGVQSLAAPELLYEIEVMAIVSADS